LRRPLSGFRWLIPLIGCLAALAAPPPAGLAPEGGAGRCFASGSLAAVVVLAVALPY
jgi:hypothetical protein